MSGLFETAARGANRRWPLYVLVAAALAALFLLVETFLRAQEFSPREEINAPGIKDISVSEQDGLYPPPDVSNFTERPEAVFVYLSVEDLPSGEDMEARVEREGSGSAFSLLLGRGDRIEVLDEQEDQLSKGSNGSTGVVKFAVRTGSGEPVPPGNYILNVYGPGTDGTVDAAEPAGTTARKLFVIEG